jgi:hypothetical protein
VESTEYRSNRDAHWGEGSGRSCRYLWLGLARPILPDGQIHNFTAFGR